MQKNKFFVIKESSDEYVQLIIENKYIVIKRSKLDKEYNDKLSSDEQIIECKEEFENICDKIMASIGHNYFVMNLDEEASVAAMHYYFTCKFRSKILKEITKWITSLFLKMK